MMKRLVEVFVLEEDMTRSVKEEFPLCYGSFVDLVRSSCPWLHESDFSWEVEHENGDITLTVRYRHPMDAGRRAYLVGGKDRAEEEWLPSRDPDQNKDVVVKDALEMGAGLEEDDALRAFKEGLVSVSGQVCKNPFMVMKDPRARVEMRKKPLQSN